jgi:hypothetical protein
MSMRGLEMGVWVTQVSEFRCPVGVTRADVKREHAHEAGTWRGDLERLRERRAVTFEIHGGGMTR